MNDTSTAQPATPPPAPAAPEAAPAKLVDVLRDPKLRAARRAELVERANKLAADARARMQTAQKNVVERAQELRRTANTTLRRSAGDGLERAANALHALAKRVQPGCGCGAAPGEEHLRH
jgi:hypothetical protein